LTATVKHREMKNDDTAWQGLIAGDRAAFEAIYNEMSDKLYRYGVKFTGNRELVQDCIHDLFLKLYRERSQLPETDNYAFYLFRLLKNILIDALRREERMVYIAPQDLPFHAEFVYGNDDDEDELDEAVRQRFETIVSLLTPRQKEAIYLRYQSDMSDGEIAELLGIDYQSARNLLYRALEKIRKNMDVKIFIALFISVIR